MAGVRLTAGADFQIPAGALRIRALDDGTFDADPIVPHLRTDMWPYWLQEAIDAAVEARKHAVDIGKSAGDEEAITRSMVLELRSSMRAVTSAAFAVDGFYAAIKARAGSHPHEDLWRQRRTSRHSQVFETLRHHLKMRNPGAGIARKQIQELFRYRGWAVHPGSKFKQVVYRADVDAGVDWHFAVFRADNAAALCRVAVNIIDVWVALMERGSPDVRAHQKAARDAMNSILDAYESSALPAVQRAMDEVEADAVERDQDQS